MPVSSLITPVSCKSGVVILGSFNIFGEEWAADLAIEEEEFKHFFMTPDASPTTLIWKDDISSFAGGTARVRGKWDNAPGQRPIQTKGIWLDAAGTGWLGFTSLVGFIIDFRILACRPVVSVDRPGAMFDFDLRLRSCLPSITGP